MLKIFRDAKRWSLIVTICTAACAMSGCLESTFRIARESRLPGGLVIPPGLTRADVSATVDFYTRGRAKFILRDRSGKTIGMVTGHEKGNPLYLRKPPQGYEPGYPRYALVVINGNTEIMEHRRQDDIIYITDDPAISEELLDGRVVK